jgi:hypothetical protein
LIDTAPEDTVKSFVSKEATPLFDVEASSAVIVKVAPLAVVLIPSPARNSNVPPRLTEPAVDDSSVNEIDEFANLAFAIEPDK